MPSRIRFTSALSVFEAFPDLSYVATRPGGDIDPLDHARALLRSSRPSDAIFFLSHLLPRRETVWWAIQCVRTFVGESGADEALRAAEAWVRRWRLRTPVIDGSRQSGSLLRPAGQAGVSFPRINSLLRLPREPARWPPIQRSCKPSRPATRGGLGQGS
jgi:hypothetical protein